MARSILPSTRPGVAARQKAIENRRVRRTVRQELARARYDDVPEDVDLRRTAQLAIRVIVRQRRWHDKINHFERWALRVTAGIPEPDGRLAKMRSIVPGGLIGDHAISHLRRWPEFDAHTWRRVWRRPEPEDVWTRLTAALREVVLLDHAELNAALVAAHRPVRWGRDVLGPRRPRTLQGLHDVNAFVTDVLAAARAASWMMGSLNGDYHPEWLQAVVSFLARATYQVHATERPIRIVQPVAPT